MLQAAIGDGHALDPLAFGEDLGGASEVDVRRRHVVEALVVMGMVTVAGEGCELPFEFAGQVVVVQRDAVLERLVPALDLALGLRVIARTAHMAQALLGEPFGQRTVNASVRTEG